MDAWRTLCQRLPRSVREKSSTSRPTLTTSFTAPCPGPHPKPATIARAHPPLPIAALKVTTVVRADGSVDRLRLAAIVFRDRAARRDLEAIVHPAVREAMRAEAERLGAAGNDLVFYDVPLLYEVGLEVKVDAIYGRYGVKLEQIVGFINSIFMEAPRLQQFYDVLDATPSVRDRPDAIDPGRNGGGDPYFTDNRLLVIEPSAEDAPIAAFPWDQPLA